MFNWPKKIATLKLPPYLVFTILLLAFIVGVLVSNFISVDWSRSRYILYFLICLCLFAAIINLILKNRLLVIISWGTIFVLCGLSVYSFFNSKYFLSQKIVEGPADVIGTVVANPQVDYSGQELVLAINDSNNLRILVKIPRYPVFNYGDVISVSGELKKPGMINDFNYAKYLKPKMISFLLLKPKNPQLVAKNSATKFQAIDSFYQIKSFFESALERVLPEPESSLGIGILTGAKRNMPQSLLDDLNTSGMTHIIALSGYNVTIIMSALALILTRFMNRKKVFWIGLILIVIFILMTGASASVVRAGIFSMLILFGRTIGRRAYQTNILFLTACLMLLFNPFLLFYDLGFQLSFLAFAGLIYLSKPINFLIERSKLGHLPQIIKSPLGETLSAQIAVFPLIAFAFGRISLISPISNILVLGMLPTVMLITFIAGVVTIIFYPLGKVIAVICWPFLAYIVKVAKVCAEIPFSAITAGKLNLLLIFSFYLIIGAVTLILKKKIHLWQKYRSI